MQRRDFLKATAAGAAMLGIFPAGLSAIEREPGKIEKRSLGKTGEKLSMIGFGGFALDRSSQDNANKWVRDAFEAGVNYFDIAPSYGIAEERMGPALEPFRSNAFLACKTAQRTAGEATAELERSLKRLRTDHFDLYQLHHVTTMNEVETIFDENGAIKAFQDARRSGKVRFLGFSAHSVEAALALMDRFEFDTIMFPVNYATWHKGNFGPQVLAKAQEKRMGILGLKAMARGPWAENAPERKDYPTCWYQPMTSPDEALMGLRFTLSHPVTAILTPADHKCLKMAIELAPKFTPLAAAEVELMKKKADQQGLIFRYPMDRRAEINSCYPHTAIG